MKIYTIIGGVNGVGKSSLTGVLSAKSNDLGVIIDTDKIKSHLPSFKYLIQSLGLKYPISSYIFFS